MHDFVASRRFGANIWEAIRGRSRLLWGTPVRYRFELRLGWAMSSFESLA